MELRDPSLGVIDFGRLLFRKALGMTAKILHNDDETMTIKVTVKKSAAFLECEENIQDALNEAGSLATEQCLEDFDSDGSPITVAGRKLTAKKDKVPKKYETPY